MFDPPFARHMSVFWALIIGPMSLACGTSGLNLRPNDDHPSVPWGSFPPTVQLPEESTEIEVVENGEEFWLAVNSDVEPVLLLPLDETMLQGDCELALSDGEGIWLVADGSIGAALQLDAQATLTVWDEERQCLVTWEFPAHQAGPPALSQAVHLAIPPTDELAIELPVSQVSDFLNELDGEERLVLGEYGFRVESANGRDLVQFTIDDQPDITAGIGHYQELAASRADGPYWSLQTRAEVIVSASERGWVHFELNISKEDVFHEAGQNRSLHFDLSIDTSTFELFLESSWEVSEHSSSTNANDEIETLSSRSRSYNFQGGSIIHEDEAEELEEELYCEFEEDSDPCCNVVTEEIFSVDSWRFVSTTGVEIPLVETEETEVTVEPEECGGN